MKPSAELVFRIAFCVLWVVFFAVRLVSQHKVQKAQLHYSRVNEKKEMLFFRLFALAYLLLIFYFLTPWIDFAHLPLPGWLRWMGAALTCAGIAVFAWTHRVLGQSWTAVLALSDQHRLVTGGPYRLVRHPMYSAFMLIGAGLMLLSANWLVGLLYLGTCLVMYAARVSDEEKMMLERFGDEYRAYMERTGRLLPKL